jgi:hypothetical protein
MTYNVKMDTNNGHIEFEGKPYEEESPDTNAGPRFTLDKETMEKLF